jgi:hypothetical protein
LDDSQALHLIIEQSEPQNGYSPYARILLATELLGDCITEAARENMRLGGKYKGLPNLENLSEVHRNREIARIAKVAVGYVGYAEKLRRHAADEIKQVLLTGELPIYRAFAFLKDRRSPRECLAEFRAEGTRQVDVRQAIRDLRKQKEGGPDQYLRSVGRIRRHMAGRFSSGAYRQFARRILRHVHVAHAGRRDHLPAAGPEAGEQSLKDIRPEPEMLYRAMAVSHPCDRKKSQGWGTEFWDIAIMVPLS